MPNILIIDDEVDLCEIYTDALTNVGHQVSTVHNATDAIKLLPHLKPNIVLLDMHLKGDSGSFVLSFIRKWRPLAATKVIVVSGFPDKAKQAVDDWGADSFLAKPVAVADLIDAVAQYTVENNS